MIAVFINMTTVIIGTLLGIFFGKKIGDKYKSVVMLSAGLVTLVIGLEMAWKSQNIIYLLLSVLIGGLVGTLINIEGGILRFGEFLKRLTPQKKDGNSSFAEAFLASSVLFCVGAMSILGSFQAGTEGKYDIILIKSVLDGFMAMVFAGVLGAGVGFSAISILLYQGALTLLAGLAKPWVDANPLILSELSGVGGVMVMMISVNLLELKKIPAGNFLPALIVIIGFVCMDPIFKSIHL